MRKSEMIWGRVKKDIQGINVVVASESEAGVLEQGLAGITEITND